MILGMSTATFTIIHVVLSLVGIFSGLIVLVGMLGARKLESWTMLFLATTALTSATGFLFHSPGFGPSHIFGVISLGVLGVALYALYIKRIVDVWRWIYVAGSICALYLNVFVGVVQAFQKLSFLRSLSPTQSDLPFLFVQLFVLAIFVVLGALAIIKFCPETKVRGSGVRKFAAG
jgi:hypothetical protein